MSALRELTAAVHVNLKLVTAGGCHLTITSNEGDFISATGGWLRPVVTEFVAMKSGALLEMAHAASFGAPPGSPEGQAPVEVVLDGKGVDDPNAFNNLWARSISLMRIAASQNAQVTKDVLFSLALLVAGSALTARVQQLDPTLGHLVAQLPLDMCHDPVWEVRAVGLIRNFTPDTIFLLPLYVRAQRSACIEALQRLRNHIVALNDGLTPPTSTDLAEFKHILYYLARQLTLESKPGREATDGRILMLQMLGLFERYHRMLQIHPADVPALLTRMQVAPERYLSRADNDNFVQEGFIRVGALLALGMRRSNLLQPAVFGAFGTPNQRRRIASRLLIEGLSSDEIRILTGEVVRHRSPST